MVGPVDVKQNEIQRMHAGLILWPFNLSHDLDLGFSRSNYELAWNESDVSR